MSRRVPIIPTIIVIAAALTMVGLGIWQLGRKAEKEALIARYDAPETGAYIREAAEAYLRKGLLRED